MIRARALSEPTAPAICRCCEPDRRRCRPRFARRVVRRSPRVGALSLRRVRPPRADLGRAVRGCASRVCMRGYVCSAALATLSFCGVKRGPLGMVSKYTVLISICYVHKPSLRWRGEHPRWQGTPVHLVGSSPRGRGTRRHLRARADRLRFIPAWGGEHLQTTATENAAAGSSPRGRGTPMRPGLRVSRVRFIPALAGNGDLDSRGVPCGTHVRHKAFIVNKLPSY